METELPPDFRELLSLLKVHNVEYLLIGGYSVKLLSKEILCFPN